MKISRKKLFIILALLFITILGVFIIIFINKQNEPKPDNLNESPISGLIDTDDMVLNAVTTETFFDIQRNLMLFGDKEYGNPSTKFVVKKVVDTPRSQKPLLIYVDIPEHNEKDVEIQIDYYSDPQNFSIPSKNFSEPLGGGTS